MLILNDIHIGFFRAGGTTIASREAMRTYLLDSFTKTLNESEEDHCLILGDLFDDFEVAGRDWVAAYSILSTWLSALRSRHLTLVAGNHDHSPKAGKVSSFEMLCTVLNQQFADRVQVIGIDQWAAVDGHVIAVAHCSNQDIFDQKLAQILDAVKSGDHVLLHANYDNNFAAVSDHSLNVSSELAKKFAEKGVTLVFAHEHQARSVIFKTSSMGVSAGTSYGRLPGTVIVLGNQWPTSVSDCLNNDKKYAHILKEDLTKIQTWHHDDEIGYAEIDWQSVTRGCDVGAKFIKVTGEASAAQASEVINAIAKFRQKNSAFVITNGVKVDGIVAAEELPAAFEATKKFDVIEYVKKHLDADEYAAVAGFMDWKIDAPAAPVSGFASMEG